MSQKNIEASPCLEVLPVIEKKPIQKIQKPKSSRRRARELIVQGLFQWQLAQEDAQQIVLFLKENFAFKKADSRLFQQVFFGCFAKMDEIWQRLIPYFNRAETEVSPVEKAILLSAAYELLYTPQTPIAVVLNEAIELSKTFGGTDGHKFVNGILDKLAAEIHSQALLHQIDNG